MRPREQVLNKGKETKENKPGNSCPATNKNLVSRTRGQKGRALTLGESLRGVRRGIAREKELQGGGGPKKRGDSIPPGHSKRTEKDGGAGGSRAKLVENSG